MTKTSAGSVTEVFAVFLKLGLTSFGGPIAHLGYFQREFVERRGWLTGSQFAQLLALCHLLPGPSSSQLGFSVGLLRAGWAGALAAFLAFTLPSALLLVGFAAVAPDIDGVIGGAVLQGLKIVAVAVVAHAVVAMARQHCSTLPSAVVALLAAITILLVGEPWAQLAVVVAGGLAGVALRRSAMPVDATGLNVHYGAGIGWALLCTFALLLAILPLAARNGGLFAVFEAFYRTGALVFGGGHVVLPLLSAAVVTPGLISADDFLAGYGAAQAVPGPMFTMAAYLGMRLAGADGGVAGATVALVAIFLPGLLLMAGVLPLWSKVSEHRRAAHRIAGAVAGVGAAVVGLLAAALYDPVWISAVRAPVDAAIALAGFVMLASFRGSALLVVIWCVGASLASAMLT